MSAHGMSETGGLREALTEYLDESERGANEWGTCGHEWLSLSKLRALLAAHPAPEADPTAGERPRCDACGDTGRVQWMVESDPNCYMERDSEGMVPCLDCATPDAGDASEWRPPGYELHRDRMLAAASTSASEPLSEDDLIELIERETGVDGQAAARAILASDWLAAREAKARAEAGEQALSRVLRWLRSGPDYHQRRSQIADHIAREVARRA